MNATEQELSQGHYMWTTLYYFIAETTLRYFEGRGERVLRKALRDYGRERGEVMRRREAISPGADPLDALLSAYDLPPHPDLECVVSRDEGGMHVQITRCPALETWGSLGGGDSAGIYLQEVLPSMVRAFDPRLAVASHREESSLYLRISVDDASSPGDAPAPWEPRTYDDDTGPVARLGNAFGLLYYHLGSSLVDELGSSGRRVLIESIQAFGKNRGFRMRKDHRERGMSIDLDTMTNNRDMPRDDRTTGERDELAPDRRLSRVFRCHYHEIWADHDGSDIGRIYCDYVHHAIWQAYHPGIELDLAKTLTRGNEICLFDVTCDLHVLDPATEEGGACLDDGE